MATRSTISIHENEKFKAVYCHWDGYPSHNGKLLLKYYNHPDIINKIMELGDISNLDISIEKPEGLDLRSPVKGYTRFFKRDMNYKDSDCTIVYSIKELKDLSDDWGAEFIYLFDTKQNKWFVSYNNSNSINFVELTNDVISEFKKLNY